MLTNGRPALWLLRTSCSVLLIHSLDLLTTPHIATVHFLDLWPPFYPEAGVPRVFTEWVSLVSIETLTSNRSKYHVLLVKKKNKTKLQYGRKQQDHMLFI